MKPEDQDDTDLTLNKPIDSNTQTLPSVPHDPTVTMQPPTTILAPGNLHDQKVIEEILAKVKKQIAAEDYHDALTVLDALLEKEPNLEAAKALFQEAQEAAIRYTQNILDQGIRFYVECDWDKAISIWKKALMVAPRDPTVKEWIHKAEVKKDQEKIVRAGLLRELEKCGKSLSVRNYVLAEEQLNGLKDQFTGGYRLADLNRIYEALVVRTRVALEKEFEDLRSNVIETPDTQPKQQQPKVVPAVSSQGYMEAFEAGKRFFDRSEWQKALDMWQKAREINPADSNLIHWIALAESNLMQQPPARKQSPIRAAFAFLGVFFVTALLTFFAFQKYQSYVQETKNHELIQRAIEHYRSGRLEESWKTLQLYVLQDPENESARQLLEKITYEMRVRQTMDKQRNEIDSLMQTANQQKAFQHYAQAILTYQQVLKIDPANVEARRNLEDLKALTESKESVQKIQDLMKQAEVLHAQGSKDSAYEKANQVLYLDPQNAAAQALRKRIEEERILSERVAVQLEVAKYLYDNAQKDASAMILKRILASDPGQPQAKQLLAKIRSIPSVPLFSAEIRIQPSAHLFVDGRDMGTRDSFQLMESVGHHILHIERLGYHSIDQAVEVKSGEKNAYTFELKPY